MKLSLLYINLISYFLFFNSRFTYSEDSLAESNFTNQDSESQSPSADSDTSGSFDFSLNTNSYNTDFSDSKSSSSDPSSDSNDSFELSQSAEVYNTDLSNNKESSLGKDTSSSFKPPEEIKFYTLDPFNIRKILEISPDKYSVRQNGKNPDKFQYEFTDNANCVKVRCDDTTIWRSGEYDIKNAKYVIYDKKSDSIMIRDEHRYVSYKLVDDDNEQTKSSEPVPEKQEHPEKEMFGSYESSVTYVTYVNDPVILSKRSRVSRVLLILTLFAMLFLITILMVGLMLMVLRVYRVVDQVKLAVYHNEHEKMMI